MAKFSQNSIELKDSEKIIFGTHDDSFMEWDEVASQLIVSTVVSGVNPTENHHLTTKYYVDNAISSGTGNIFHNTLLGLDSDDHLQYILVDGSRSFTNTISGVYPTDPNHLTTKQYVIDLVSGNIPVASGDPITSLTNYSFIQELGVSQTTSTSYVHKIRLTASGLPYGNYRMGWTFEWRQSKTNSEFWARLQIDDSNTIFEYEASPYVDVDFWNIVTDLHYETLSSGTHYIDLDYSTGSNSVVSYIKNAKLEMWRVL